MQTCSLAYIALLSKCNLFHCTLFIQTNKTYPVMYISLRLNHVYCVCKQIPLNLSVINVAGAQGSFLYTNTVQGEGEGGSSKGERENSRWQTGWLKQSFIHSTRPGIGRPSVHPCPSTLLLMTLGFQELATALTPVRTGVEARIRI